MPRFSRFRPFRHSPAWLLAIGLFAMAMQATGGIGLMPRAAAGGSFQVEICTSKGVSKFAAAALSGQTSLPHVPDVPDAGHQDCCTLCAAGAPLLLAVTALGVSPAPTFSSAPLAGNFLPPATLTWLAHPPRGPPPA